MSKVTALYLLHHVALNREKCSWRREYFRFTLKGRLSSVSETEDKVLTYTVYPKIWLPAGCVLSTRAEYQAARVRYRQDAAERKRLAVLEKQRKEHMQESLDIARGFLPPRVKPTPLLVIEPTPEVVANPFDEFTIIDTEYQHDVLLEVAAIRYKNWQPVQEYVSFVQYTGWVSPFTTQHTGITEANVRGGTPEKQVLEELLKLAGNSLLIAHNIGADRSQLEKASARQALPVLTNKWFCTMALARAREPKGAKAGLTELCDRYRFGNVNAHRALSDVKRTFLILRHYHQQHPLLSLDPKAKAAAQSTLEFAA
jgi:DNA polymerase III epsilon subunit-like protein